MQQWTTDLADENARIKMLLDAYYDQQQMKARIEFINQQTEVCLFDMEHVIDNWMAANEHS